MTYILFLISQRAYTILARDLCSDSRSFNFTDSISIQMKESDALSVLFQEGNIDFAKKIEGQRSRANTLSEFTT